MTPLLTPTRLLPSLLGDNEPNDVGYKLCFSRDEEQDTGANYFTDVIHVLHHPAGHPCHRDVEDSCWQLREKRDEGSIRPQRMGLDLRSDLWHGNMDEYPVSFTNECVGVCGVFTPHIESYPTTA